MKPCENIYQIAKDWCSKRYSPFTSDDFKNYFLKTYMPPRNPNSFGAIFMYLSMNGLIRDNGIMVKSRFPAAKCRKITQWISKEYSEKQQKNRKITQYEINFSKYNI